MRKFVITAIAVLAIASMASAAVITAGSATLKNSGAQAVGTVDITLSGGDLVQGLNLWLKVGNFTQEITPMITARDWLGTGKVFALSNTGINDTGATGGFDLPSNIYFGSTTTNTAVAANVPANGVAATFTIDATGVAPGLYPLMVGFEYPDVGQLDSDFVGVAAQLVNGMITVTPEPTALALLGLGGLFIRRRRA